MTKNEREELLKQLLKERFGDATRQGEIKDLETKPK
jgi:hypothetical protein